jgi:dihydrofolate reductase
MNLPRVNLILARAANGVIGLNNTLPWHLPEDMAHFKALTLGHPVVMGRKTWDSLPAKFRPLPGRRNIVVTRNPDWHDSGAERAGSLHEALRMCAHAQEVFVIGGAQIYAEALPLAQRAYITEIANTFEGDAFFPPLPERAWIQTLREPHVSASGLPFAFVTYERTLDAHS